MDRGSNATTQAVNTTATKRVFTSVALVTLWLAGAAAGLAADAPATIVVDARLLQKSAGMTKERIAPYREGLVIHEWRVLNVSAGALAAKTIRVAHWGFFDDLPQDILKSSECTHFTRPVRRLYDRNGVDEETDRQLKRGVLACVL